MSCNTIRSLTTEYLDDRVLAEDCAAIDDHLGSCSSCSNYVESGRRLRASLKRLPVRMPPQRLDGSLRLAATLARAQIAEGGGFNWRDKLHLFVRNLMQPFAVPAMGGIVSAIVLFSVTMPGISIRVNPMRNDVPLNVSTDASAKYFAPIGLSESELVLDLVVDSAGRMVDYSVVSGSELLRDATLKRQIENNLLFTEFTPATLLGGRTSGRVRLRLKSDHINIRG